MPPAPRKLRGEVWEGLAQSPASRVMLMKPPRPVAVSELPKSIPPTRPLPSANRLGQAPRPARRRGDREQEVVELNSSVGAG